MTYFLKPLMKNKMKIFGRTLPGLLCLLAFILIPVAAQAGLRATVLELSGRRAWLELTHPGQLAPGSRVELVYQAGSLPMLMGEWEVLEQRDDRLLLGERRVAVPLIAGMKVGIEPKPVAKAGMGLLRVSVRKNGRPTFGRLYVYQRPGDKLVRDLEVPVQGHLELELPPGQYRAAVLHTGLPNGPTVKLKPFTLSPGGRIEKTAEFAEGWLEVEAFSRGKAVAARLKVYRDDGYFLTESHTKPPKPARFSLVPGVYAVEAIQPGQEHGTLVRAIMVRQAGTTKGRVTID